MGKSRHSQPLRRRVRQRLATIEQVKDEWKATMQEVRAIAHESTDSALSVGKELIDHLVRRLAVLVGGIALCVAPFAAVLGMAMRSNCQS
ncbi:MAG: hypothetical protein GDA67_12350 [Nitrospira sp. CR1.3]|nr:hypothetical protein [Nitrospira sp. CR1.3]